MTQLFSISIPGKIKNIWFGDVQTATGIRRRAYETSLAQIKALNFQSIGTSLKEVLNLDYELILEKFLFDKLYQECEFSNFVCQYIIENPNALIFLYKSPVVNFKNSRLISGLSFIFSTFFISIFYLYFCSKNGCKNSADGLPIKNSLICEVDSPQVFDMFSNIFREQKEVIYFTQKYYINNFEKKDILKHKLISHYISKSEKRLLRSFALRFLTTAFLNYKELSRMGFLYFDLYKVIANGLLITPYCTNCTYLTFEHMSTVKAIRNEFLRESNNISIFVPYNTYAIDHYFAPEYRYNYEVLCSPCKILEDVYQIQRASTSVYLPTGSYAYHYLSGVEDHSSADRLRGLEEFKGSSTVITILSSGIQDASISGEARLMELANKISSIDGVKVIIRPKPVKSLKKYEGYLEKYFGKNQNILLTDEKYNLFDFIHVTDLFITGFSSSAVDLCNAGGEFFSVDFWDDKDMYLWQTAVDGVYLDEDEAFNNIRAWIKDYPIGQRNLHSKRMEELRELTRYWMGDFESYKRNMLRLLKPYFPYRASNFLKINSNLL